jgi:hypothetical protein
MAVILKASCLRSGEDAFRMAKPRLREETNLVVEPTHQEMTSRDDKVQGATSLKLVGL